MEPKEARQIAVSRLEAKGYKIRDLSSGQGRPKLSQVEMLRGGERLVCAIKVANKSTNGRIHFPRAEDGTYHVLSEVDRVLHVRPMPDGNVRITMFDQATVLAAFDKSLKALSEKGQEHLPIWVSLEREAGWRQVGSGFGDKALWSETVSPGGASVAAPVTPAAPPSSPAGETIRPLSIADAKLAVAAKYEVTPDKVEIIVRG